MKYIAHPMKLHPMKSPSHEKSHPMKYIAHPMKYITHPMKFHPMNSLIPSKVSPHEIYYPSHEIYYPPHETPPNVHPAMLTMKLKIWTVHPLQMTKMFKALATPCFLA